MIKQIAWEEILPIWQNKLWPGRASPIESNSAMVYLGGYDINNMTTNPAFFACMLDGKIIGVNSGHRCADGSYRSRGLWVDTNYRKLGIASSLLTFTHKHGIDLGCTSTWSYPRQSSWSAYQRAGFELSSIWTASETSDANAYAQLLKS